MVACGHREEASRPEHEVVLEIRAAAPDPFEDCLEGVLLGVRPEFPSYDVELLELRGIRRFVSRGVGEDMLPDLLRKDYAHLSGVGREPQLTTQHLQLLEALHPHLL